MESVILMATACIHVLKYRSICSLTVLLLDLKANVLTITLQRRCQLD